MRRFGFLFIVVVCSCGGENDQSDYNHENDITDKYFPNFPEQQFHDLTMGQKTEFAVANLQNAAYVVKSDQPQHHLNEANNVEVVIPDSDVLMGFKVFLMDEKDIQQRSIISEFFDKHSVSSEKSETFSVYAFKSENLEFTTSLFAQKEFLRLNFELKSSH